MRKSFDVSGRAIQSVIDVRSRARRKTMNDIMYYLRRLMKLARTAQKLSILEGTEFEDSVQEELDDIEKGLAELEKDLIL